MNNEIKCRDCKYCEECGRTTKQYHMPIGRKIYQCIHSKIYDLKDKLICYGEALNSKISQQLQEECLQIIDKALGEEKC